MKPKNIIIICVIISMLVLIAVIEYEIRTIKHNEYLKNQNTKTIKSKYSINGCNLEIYVIDSCEYIGNVQNAYSDKLTHKGNCKFCKLRNKQ